MCVRLFKYEASYIGTRLPMIIEPLKWDDESFGGYLSNNTKHFKYLIHQQSQTDSLKCPTGIGQRLKMPYGHIWYGE